MTAYMVSGFVGECETGDRSITRLPWSGSSYCIVHFRIKVMATTVRFCLSFPPGRLVTLAGPYIRKKYYLIDVAL